MNKNKLLLKLLYITQAKAFHNVALTKDGSPLNQAIFKKTFPQETLTPMYGDIKNTSTDSKPNALADFEEDPSAAFRISLALGLRSVIDVIPKLTAGMPVNVQKSLLMSFLFPETARILDEFVKKIPHKLQNNILDNKLYKIIKPIFLPMITAAVYSMVAPLLHLSPPSAKKMMDDFMLNTKNGLQLSLPLNAMLELKNSCYNKGLKQNKAFEMVMMTLGTFVISNIIAQKKPLKDILIKVPMILSILVNILHQKDIHQFIKHRNSPELPPN